MSKSRTIANNQPQFSIKGSNAVITARGNRAHVLIAFGC